SRVSNLHIIDNFSNDWTYSEALIVFVIDDYFNTGILLSNIHESWLTKYASTMKNDVRYIVSDCYETFPIPENNNEKVASLTQTYFDKRDQFKLNYNFGLNQLYRKYHNKAEFGFEIEEIRELHKNIDIAVQEAYGWQDIALRHDFYEVEYLPENDRVRYTIHPEARKEILKRLLELNHKIHAEEVAAGLWDKKKAVKKEKVVKGKGNNLVNEPREKYGQGELFGE
ncbi:MAG: type IIL restriction-modification enzyme MmeI, partial [Candidatus Paceibacterota bacterium]